MNTKHQEKFSELIVSEVEEAAIRRRADRVGNKSEKQFRVSWLRS